MKTVINEKTGEYEIAFESRKELENFLSKKPYQQNSFYLTHKFEGMNIVHEEVKVTMLENDSENIVFEFFNQNTHKREHRTVIPLRFIKKYDKIVINALAALEKEGKV